MTARYVLVGLSPVEVAERHRLDAAVGKLQQAGSTASLAYLQLGDPSLSTELTRLADAGAVTIALAGVSLGSQAPAQSWVRRVAGHWWRERGEDRPVVHVATSVLRNDLDMLDAHALRGVLDLARPITGSEAALNSPGWEDVPSHRHQVMICRGPRCAARGAEATALAFALSLTANGLGDDDILLTQTGCQFPCNHAPVVSVQPEDVWYGRVDDDVVARIISEHLVGDSPVDSHRLSRTRSEAANPEDLP